MIREQSTEEIPDPGSQNKVCREALKVRSIATDNVIHAIRIGLIRVDFIGSEQPSLSASKDRNT